MPSSEEIMDALMAEMGEKQNETVLPASLLRTLPPYLEEVEGVEGDLKDWLNSVRPAQWVMIFQDAWKHAKSGRELPRRLEDEIRNWAGINSVHGAGYEEPEERVFEPHAGM